ncbi:DNA-binding transcriptional response regulator, NtrC family, contains REC, AAA-type ATPase, and a Fis-type DNA-binding domains [Pedobacter westerhofensis]|uniref:DNA-binding transcriptional response regulator, NtrC family, contains REC, AAA-type ATPase, and a Fis-type DNA-binding domains n=1 Tax=Pedobacter westerhofensis TaxID=425512 RepID=A0A521BFT3_9SPHI|nr:sigma-54-dependent Fis family transcriptional regulator [Pedobacter westerhofensis]SMO45932.1 DNA-binding transcriptional response regulator, NtrC family, contains REC, AAA-type ATPase, and a Fis-type DNA-binding domains [Pedobacter westerhofensis]
MPERKNDLEGEYFSLKQLLQGIFSKLQPLFSTDCAAITLYQNDDEHIARSYIALRNCKGEFIAEQLIRDPVAFSSITREISGFQFPVLRSAEDWMAEFGNNHHIINHPEEYLYHCYIPLEANNRIMGTFEIHNLDQQFSSEALNYCCSISDLVSGLLTALQPLPALPTGEELLSTIRKQQAELEKYKKELDKHLQYFAEESAEPYHYPDMAGNSREMQQVFKLLDRMSSSDTTVLILGETGTGKELIARAIHQQSPRKDQPMIKINCAAVPRNLIESELFGHEKGSFTGAMERRIGKFELADRGTIFLDEVAELSPDLQVKLLRVLQEKEIERIGGKSTIATDVRIISATNRNLFNEVEAGRFRTDLFYRLNVFPIELPPLRNRRLDIPALAAYFLERFSSKSGRKINGFSKKVMACMMAYNWPGNVRELEHLIERQVILTEQPVITELAIPEGGKGLLAQHVTGEIIKTVMENERDHILAVLERCNGKVSGPHGAARLLGIPATTLNSKIKKLGLSKKHK